MTTIIEFMKKRDGFHFAGKTDEKEIIDAERSLNVHFSEDYREYVSAYGAARFDGHELTGICSASRLNVVDVTTREKTDLIPAEFYVIEELNIDGIIIWQASNGEVYESQAGKAPRMIATSLEEYLSE